MTIPKVKFEIMSVEDNIDIVKWAYFEHNQTLDVYHYAINYFPALKEIDPALPMEEIMARITKIVADYYQEHIDEISNVATTFQNIWQGINEEYFNGIVNFLNIPYGKVPPVINVFIGFIPVNPRDLASSSFFLDYNLNEKELIGACAHEILHFLWFIKWKELFPHFQTIDFDSPHIIWKYSEAVVAPILNSPNIKKITNCDSKAYNSLYSITDGDVLMMDRLRMLYSENISIEEKIIQGFEYVKNVLSNQVITK